MRLFDLKELQPCTRESAHIQDKTDFYHTRSLWIYCITRQKQMKKYMPSRHNGIFKEPSQKTHPSKRPAQCVTSPSMNRAHSRIVYRAFRLISLKKTRRIHRVYSQVRHRAPESIPTFLINPLSPEFEFLRRLRSVSKIMRLLTRRRHASLALGEKSSKIPLLGCGRVLHGTPGPGARGVTWLERGPDIDFAVADFDFGGAA